MIHNIFGVDDQVRQFISESHRRETLFCYFPSPVDMQSLCVASSGPLQISGDNASESNGYLEREESLGRNGKLVGSQKLEEIVTEL